MNFRYVAKQLGLLLVVLSVALLLMALAFFLIEHHVSQKARASIFLTGLGGLLAGGVLWRLARDAPVALGRREALLLVAVTWIVGAGFAALPFFLWTRFPDTDAPPGHPFHNFINCYFEAMSGLTTTGATILSDVEGVPRSLLLWRAFTQWIGGLGIVVLFVAVLPSLGVGGKRIFLIEAPGPSPEGLQPQIRHTARVLLQIYLGLTAAQIVALLIAGMSFYDSVCHTFTTLATGGFSTKTASTGAFNSPAVDIILIVFMVLAGANFALYFALLRRRFGSVLRDPELRTYLAMLAIGSLIVVLCLLRREIVMTDGTVLEPSAAQAIRHGVFTTVSIATTTGYCTADYEPWPFAAKAVLVAVMFIGASAGSTAGGFKVIRLWLVVKVMLSEIEHVFRPKVVRPVRLGRNIIDDELKLGTMTYVLGFVLLFAAGSVAVMLLEQQLNPSAECDYTTAASASIACLSTIGPGLAKVGAIENYGWMTSPSKVLLSVWMALGRLEVFALIVLLTPRFWHGD